MLMMSYYIVLHLIISSLRRFMINQTLEQATRVLSLPSLSSSLPPSDDFQLRNSIAPPTFSMKESPKLRNKPNRSTTFNTSRGTSVDIAELKRKSAKKPSLERGKSFKFEETVDKDKQVQFFSYLLSICLFV